MLDRPRQPLGPFTLPVSDGHTLAVETFGNRNGIPVVHLHGGPGSGAQQAHKTLFDSARHFGVLYDQRGAGRSTSIRSRQNNTTAHHIADLEALRAALGIDRWIVAGGSWGATLALAYAQAHPGRVSGIVLRATFLGTRAELDRAFRVTLPTFFPDLAADFLAHLSEPERENPLDAYWRRILDSDPAIHAPAAWGWHDTERALSTIMPSATRLSPHAASERLPATPFMEAHYFSENCFLAPNQLLNDARLLCGIPGIIVQGRHDLLCPPATAAALASRWPDAAIRMVEGAGHALSDPGVTDAVRQAIAELAAIG